MQKTWTKHIQHLHYLSQHIPGILLNTRFAFCLVILMFMLPTYINPGVTVCLNKLFRSLKIPWLICKYT